MSGGRELLLPRRRLRALALRLLRLAERQASCWILPSHRNREGYGRVRVHAGGRRVELRASRVVWTARRGAIPAGLEIAHRCDQPGCIRPGHLFLATHAQNMADMARKDRAHRARGELSPRAKLREAEVLEIRAMARSGLPHPAIAASFGVARQTVQSIVARARWAHC